MKSTPAGKLHDHYTWDLTAVLYAVRPNDGYFSLSPKGKISTFDDGGSKFEGNAVGNAQHMIMDDTQRIRVLEAMELLVSQPPQRTH
jgi:hypothetical protein